MTPPRHHLDQSHLTCLKWGWWCSGQARQDCDPHATLRYLLLPQLLPLNSACRTKNEMTLFRAALCRCSPSPEPLYMFCLSFLYALTSLIHVTFNLTSANHYFIIFLQCHSEYTTQRPHILYVQMCTF